MQLQWVQAWARDLAAGLVVLVLGLIEAYSLWRGGYVDSAVPWLIPVVMAVAIALVRREGWWSLGLLWGLLVVQAFTVTDIMLIELAVAGVAFGLARWGSIPLLWVSGLSIPIATLLGVGYIFVLAGGIWNTRIARNLIVPIVSSGVPWPLVVLPMIAGLLALPWLAGLATRYWGAARESSRTEAEASAEAERAQRERAQMAEIAVLRERQAELARDVHDVVGHSLTVILAQAESAQYVDDDDALKRTMANIAESARTSLREVRAVLSSPDGACARAADLDALIETTRASGQEISVADVGAPRPLPPEISTVAFRVLQELLTNAIKHGRRDATITVVRDWDDELRLTVSNPVDGPSGGHDGNGLEGMRRRLESVGGILQSAALSSDGTTFTARAAIPVRAGRSGS